MAAGTGDCTFFSKAEGDAPEVLVYHKCPKTLLQDLQFVVEAIHRGVYDKAHRDIKGRLNGKTVGIMSATFKSKKTQSIVAISGQGANEWSGETRKIGNAQFLPVTEALKGKENIVWAPLTYEHTEYQTLPHGETISEDNKEIFTDEFVKRLQNKVKHLKEANPTEDEVTSAVMKSAQYRPDMKKEDFDFLVSCYVQFSRDESFFKKVCQEMKDLGRDSLKKAQEDVLKLSNHVFQRIKEDIKRDDVGDIKSLGEQAVIAKYIEPYRMWIPEIFLTTVCVALEVIPPPGSTTLANLSVSCAEDNALKKLCELRDPKDPVTRIEWFSATLDFSKGVCPLLHKKLCPFCAVSFVPRAKAINSMTVNGANC